VNLDPLSAAISGALVEYHCAKNHVHTLTIPEAAEALDSTKGIRFGDVICPICERDRTGWIPPSRIRAIWWETATKEEVARRKSRKPLQSTPEGW
jgi:hypothetical protein